MKKKIIVLSKWVSKLEKKDLELDFGSNNQETSAGLFVTDFFREFEVTKSTWVVSIFNFQVEKKLVIGIAAANKSNPLKKIKYKIKEFSKYINLNT